MSGTAKVIKPTSMTPAMLVSTTATETYAVWTNVAYVVGDRRIVLATKRVYERLLAGTTNISPELDTVNWLDVAPTNANAMFDNMISTATVAANTLTVVIDTGYINSLSIVGAVGTAVAISMTDGAGGPEIYNRSISLDGTLIDDWYQYFFEPSVQLSTMWLTELPPYIHARLTITITAPGPVAIGMLTFGTFYLLGDTELGASAGFLSYSKKDTDIYGATRFVPGANAQPMSLALVLKKAQINKVHSILKSLDAIPCMWIGVDDSSYLPFAVFGFFKDFMLVVPYQMESLYNIEIQGLI